MLYFSPDWKQRIKLEILEPGILHLLFRDSHCDVAGEQGACDLVDIGAGESRLDFQSSRVRPNVQLLVLAQSSYSSGATISTLLLRLNTVNYSTSCPLE